MESEFNYIAQLDGELKALVDLSVAEDNSYWRLGVHLFYENEPAGYTSFNLNGYSYEEAEKIARNIAKNDFLMKEIDEFLWGESD